jgi:hypothetical protein
VWSSDHLSLQMYPHHLCTIRIFPSKPFLEFHTTYQLFASATIPLLWTKIMQNWCITHGWDGEYSRENRFALCYLCTHILQWKDSPPPLYTVVYITDQMIASPGPTYHTELRWSGSRGGNNHSRLSSGCIEHELKP